MRDLRTLNMISGQKIEFDEVLKRSGDLDYRNFGTLIKMTLYDDGQALIMQDGCRVEPFSSMIINVPSGAVFQRLFNLDVIPCLQTVDQTVTIAAATGAPRVDMVEATIKLVTDRDDVAQVANVSGSSVSITNQAIKRDIKYFLQVQAKTGTTAVTAAVAGSVVGTVNLSGTVDLSSRYLLNISDGEDGSFQEIDCRGGAPAATTRAEIITAINTAVGRTMAVVNGNFIEFQGEGLGQTSYFTLKPAVTDVTKDAMTEILALAREKVSYEGTNAWFKLAEIDVGAATVTVTSGLIRNLDEKDTWASGDSDVLLNIFQLKDGYIQGASYNPEIVTGNTSMENNKQYYVNGATGRLEMTLPVKAKVGTKTFITDIGSRGWKVPQNATQYITWMNQKTVPGTTGYIESKSGYASIELVCVVEDTAWIAENLRDVVSFKGYILGGNTGARIDVIEDLNFQVESSNVITATLSAIKDTGAGASSFVKGYMMGGFIAAVTDVIDSLIFNSETYQAVVEVLDNPKNGGTGCQSNSKGYIMGGFVAAVTDVIEDLIFSNDTSQAIVAALSVPKKNGAGCSSSLKGYMMGGENGGVTAVIDSLIFSSDTYQAVTATLNPATQQGAGSQSNLKGYNMGGIPAGFSAVIEDLIFSNETSQAITATLNTPKSEGCGISGSLKGYILGGNTGAVSAVIEDLNFVTESSQAITATLDTAKKSGTGVQGYN